MLNPLYRQLTAFLVSSGCLFCLSVPCSVAVTPRDEPSMLSYSALSLVGIAIKNIAVSSGNTFLENNYPKFFKKQYRVSGVYDSGMTYSFFIPFEQFRPYYSWWDTGILLGGSGVGCWQVLSQQWLNQPWFVGVYGYV